MNCYDCEFYDFDYVWDGEDEYRVDICEVDHGEYFNSDEECPYHKKYIQPKHNEEDTECDKCEFLEQCKDSGYVINCTSYEDSREHFVRGRAGCRKWSY